jgi:hypothetical protein
MLKRGSTLAMEEVVKMILGIIALIILVMLLGSFIKMFIGNAEKEKATKTMDDFEYFVNNLKEGEAKEFLVEGPTGWAWVEASSKEICFCKLTHNVLSRKGDSFAQDRSAFITTCKNIGVCKSFNQVIIFQQSICTAGQVSWITNDWRNQIINQCYFIEKPTDAVVKKTSQIQIDFK